MNEEAKEGMAAVKLPRRQFLHLAAGAAALPAMSRIARAGTRLLFTVMVCAVISSQAIAQNRVSQRLLELSEDERNEAFTHLLHDNHVQCDMVVRTLFNGATVELDDWEVLCRDRNAFSLSIPPELSAGIDFLDCRELLATNKMLLKKAGSKIKARGCRIKSVEKLRSSRRLIR